MDCCLCSSLGTSYRPPRNNLCMSCYDGAKSIIDLCRKLEQEWRDEDGEKARQPGSHGLQYAFKQIKQLEQMEENVSEKLEFLESLVEAFQTGMHTDVELITNDGLSIHAHRVVMVSISIPSLYQMLLNFELSMSLGASHLLDADCVLGNEVACVQSDV
jgi:speckle-type POZ protein